MSSPRACLGEFIRHTGRLEGREPRRSPTKLSQRHDTCVAYCHYPDAETCRDDFRCNGGQECSVGDHMKPEQPTSDSLSLRGALCLISMRLFLMAHYSCLDHAQVWMLTLSIRSQSHGQVVVQMQPAVIHSSLLTLGRIMQAAPGRSREGEREKSVL